MVAPRRSTQTQAQVLEAGSLIFFYRPRPDVMQPQSSDEIAQCALAMFPDDQGRHLNRLFLFDAGTFPPIIPGQNSPIEEGWAYATVASTVAHEVIDGLEENVPVPPGQPNHAIATPARVVADGRYQIARQNDHTYLAYGLHRPRQLGVAQQTVLLDEQGIYLLLVKEPNYPTPRAVPESPDYPADLGKLFAGHATIPADPPELLDYQFAQIYLIGKEVDVHRSLGLTIEVSKINDAEAAAYHQLNVDANQIQSRDQFDIFEPVKTGNLV